MRPATIPAVLAGIAPPLAICSYLAFSQSPDTLVATSLALTATALIARLLPSRHPLSTSVPWPFLVLVAVPFLQCLPLPRILWKLVTSLDDDLRFAATSVGISLPPTWSIQPEATLRAATTFTAAMAAYLLCRHAAQRTGTRTAFLTALLTVALWQALLGISQYVSGVALIETGQVAHGSFTNRGYYAAFLSAGLWLAVGVFASMAQRARSSSVHLLGAVLSASVAIAAAGAIMASLSRAAIVVNAVLLCLSVPYLPKAARRITLALAVVPPLVIFLIHPELPQQLLARFEQLIADGGDPGRLLIWSDGLRTATAHPFGSGASSFSWAFHRNSAYFLRNSVNNAHSDYVEWAVEYGPFFAVGIVIAIVAALVKLSARSRRNHHWVGLAAVAAASALALHGAVDSVLHTPAMAALFASLVGIASGLPGRQPVTLQRSATALLATGLCAATLLLGGTFWPLALSDHFTRARQQHLQGNTEAAHRSYQRALVACPHAAPAWLGLADLAYAAGDTTEALRLARVARSVEPFTYRVEWALAGHQFAAGDVLHGVDTLRTVCRELPDLRPGAYLLAWRAGASLNLIESELTTPEPYAVGEYLAFLIRTGNHSEVPGAYERLVIQPRLSLSNAHMRYLNKHITESQK